MPRRLLLLTVLALLTVPATAGAATKGDGWAPGGAKVRGQGTPALQLKRFATFTLHRPTLDAKLGRGRSEILLPAPDGQLERFAVTPSEVMAPALAAKHPDIQTFSGRSVADPGTTVAVDVGPLGLHASVRGTDGAWYVDPYLRRSQAAYASYYGRDVVQAPNAFVEREPPAPRAEAQLLPTLSTGPVLRTYRLALASDAKYASYFGASNVTAAKVTLMNRVDQVYGQDLSIRMVLIGANDSLNFNTASAMTSAGYSSSSPVCDGTTLSDNQTVIDHVIGSANYDIGHIVLGADGGGLAALGVVGRSGLKAQGCTGITTPVGDQFAIDYVAHEMGHEFGADHTFNGVTTNCAGGNRNASTSVEPGSGSSIMAYAGICGGDNLQAHSDPYFSERSLDQINTYVSSNAAYGGAQTSTNDHAPVVTAPSSYTIPVRTPFVLTGSATDADNDNLTYLWEQNDPGGASGTYLLSSTKTNGPLFRQFSSAAVESDPSQSPATGENLASADPTRTFPDLAQIAANDTDATGGTCSDVACYSEFLPTTAYAGPMHFRLTARDGRGGVASADTTVTLAPASVAPLRVTSQGSGGTINSNTDTNVTWTTGTSGLPGAANVKITLSTDGGQTFPYTLDASTANDGTDTVQLPSVNTTHGRIRVQPTGNVFFDMSHADFTINPIGPVVSVTPSGSHTVAYSDPISPEPTITATDSQPMTASTPSGLPAGLSLTGPTVSGNTSTWKITGTATGAPGTSNVTFSVSDGTYSSPVSVPVTVVPEQATATYMGDTAATGNPAAVRLAATVAEVADGSPGDLSLATVTFKEGSRTLCGPVAVSGGSAACNASLTPGAHTVTVAIGGRYTGSGTGHVAVTAPAPTPTPTPSPTPSPTPAPTPTPTPVAPVNAAVCSTPIALTNVSQHGKRVTIAGYAQSSLVGKRLALRAGKRTVGHATVHPDGSFSAKVKAPKGRHAGQTRYSARSGSQHSATVTLSRALTAGATSRLRGRLTGPHDARRKLAVVERTDCSGAQQVKRIRTDARGRFSLTIARPAANTIDVYVVRTASGRPAAKSLPVVVR